MLGSLKGFAQPVLVVSLMNNLNSTDLDLYVLLGLEDSHPEAAVSDWLVASHHDGSAVTTNVLKSSVPWAATVIAEKDESTTRE